MVREADKERATKLLRDLHEQLDKGTSLSLLLFLLLIVVVVVELLILGIGFSSMF